VTVKAIDPNGLVRDIRSDSSGNLSTTLGTRLAGEDFSIDRLKTVEVWDYGSGNLSYSTAGTTPQLLRATPSILGVAQVISADSGVVVTFYDNDEAVASGTVLGVLACDTAGVQVRFCRPAQYGIVAVFSGGSDPKTAVVSVGRL